MPMRLLPPCASSRNGMPIDMIDMKILPSGAKTSLATLKPLTTASETKMSSTSVKVFAPSKRPRASTCVPATPRKHRHVLARVWLQVREVDQPVLSELRMHRHVPQAQPAAEAVVHLRHSADGFGIEHAGANDAQAARALGDQDVAVRQEVQGRRSEEALDRDDAKALVAEAQYLRLVGQRVGADPLRPCCALLMAMNRHIVRMTKSAGDCRKTSGRRHVEPPVSGWNRPRTAIGRP